MNFIKGKFLIKLHNCFKCHNNLRCSPKLKNQNINYLFWSLNQYNLFKKNKLFKRNNFIMKSQLQNLSTNDIYNILYFLNYFY